MDEAGDPGAGGSNISWASWAQSTDVPCTDPKTSLFNTANWGQLVFEETDPLVPIPADRPTILFVNADSFTTIHADIDLIEFFQDAGYAVVPFTSTGTPEDLRAAAAGKNLVFISETIGSASVLDPAGSATGVFSLKDTDVPVRYRARQKDDRVARPQAMQRGPRPTGSTQGEGRVSPRTCLPGVRFSVLALARDRVEMRASVWSAGAC